jgi:hypothetical protein
MKRALRVLAVAGALLGLEAPAQAQNCQELTKLPASGSWAEWRAHDNEIRVAVLPPETRQGKPYVRMETKITESGRVMIMQGLAPADRLDDTEEVIIKQGTEPAMRLPKEMIQVGRELAGKDPSRTTCSAGMKLVGQETVSVPAGTFATSRFKDEQSGYEIWLSEQVPFGMIKMRVGPDEEILLSAYGAGATSSISETPIEMPRQ